MASFQLSVVAPDRTVFEDTVDSAVLPGVYGYMGIMAGHEPMILALRAGIISMEDTTRQRHHVSVGGGFAEISEGKVIILADDAQFSSEIDVAAAELLLEEARKALRGESSTMNSDQATEELERAMARIKASRLN